MIRLRLRLTRPYLASLSARAEWIALYACGGFAALLALVLIRLILNYEVMP